MPDTFYEPLSARDAWFLYAERADTPLDIATVYVCEGTPVTGGRGAQGIEETIASRLHLVPRYRQKIHRVSFNLAHPVWVDDPHFDLGFHVRREVLPPPGTGAQLRATAMRVMARPLDIRRPLWELTIITGLRDDRVVLVNRAHHAMVDGMSSVDILTLLLDPDPEGTPVTPPPEPWRPRPAPSDRGLIRKLLWDPLPGGRARESPWEGFQRLMMLWRQPWQGMFSLGRSALRPRPKMFWNRPLGPSRTGRGLKVPLESFKALKNRYGCTVNDAVLAVVADGLHRWLRARGEWLPETVGVFVPVSVRDPNDRAVGNKISGMVLELPTGAMSLEERLKRIHRRTGDLKRSLQAVAADRIVGLADWAPPSILVLAGRLMSTPQAGANLNVTNIPGPQFPLYTGGARLLEVWPFAPLYPGMGLGVAIVSYDGQVYFGLTADPSVVPDVEDFTGHINQAAAACAALVA